MPGRHDHQPPVHLVGAAEIGRMFGGISRQRVQQIVSLDDFPGPYAVLAAGKVWRTDDVKAWAEEHGRKIHGEGQA